MLANQREDALAVAQENMAGRSADFQRENERGSRHDVVMAKTLDSSGEGSKYVSPCAI